MVLGRFDGSSSSLQLSLRLVNDEDNGQWEHVLLQCLEALDFAIMDCCLDLPDGNEPLWNLDVEDVVEEVIGVFDQTGQLTHRVPLKCQVTWFHSLEIGLQDLHLTSE